MLSLTAPHAQIVMSVHQEAHHEHIRAKNLGDWSNAAAIYADGGEGIGFFGWEMADAAALAAVAARLEAAGISAAHGSLALADERRLHAHLVPRSQGQRRLSWFLSAPPETSGGAASSSWIPEAPIDRARAKVTTARAI